jgi:hypothetical protein
MPTIIGAIFFCSGLYFFLFKEDGLLGLLIISSIFEASSAINVGQRGIQPYYLVAAFIIARGFVKWALGAGPRESIPQRRWLLAFGVIGVLSAFVLPAIFAGVPIYDSKVGIDESLFIRPPLQFGLNNIGQAGFLAWHIATALAVLSIPASKKKILRAYILAFYLVLLVVVGQVACQRMGIAFPDALIRNNPGYLLSNLTMLGSSGARNPGTFTEPSYAGAFFAMYCLGFIVEYLKGKGSAARVLISLIASGMVASTTSLLVIALLAPLAILCYSPFRFPWYVNVRKTRRIALVVFLVIAPMLLILVISPEYRQLLIVLTVAKGDSSSFFNRTAADLFALQLLPQSHWIGVGLGSNRASSMLTTLLSNVGIMGVFAFGVFYIKLFGKLPEQYAWLRWAGFALLLNMCIGIADVTSPILWIPILLAIRFSREKPIEQPTQLRGNLVLAGS